MIILLLNKNWKKIERKDSMKCYKYYLTQPNFVYQGFPFEGRIGYEISTFGTYLDKLHKVIYGTVEYSRPLPSYEVERYQLVFAE